jgi:hypothetical protein
MTRSEAQVRCAELNDAAAGEPGVRWMAREKPSGHWGLVRVHVPGQRATGPLTTTQESRPRPGADDPRPLIDPLLGTGGLG